MVNALSEWLEVEVYRNGKTYYQRYQYGQKATELKIKGSSKHTGTKITFFPDTTIFEDINFDAQVIKQRLRELAFLNKGTRIVFKDLRSNQQEQFKYDGGIVQFVSFLNQGKEVIPKKPIYIEKEKTAATRRLPCNTIPATTR